MVIKSSFMDTYLSELKSNRKKTMKRIAKCLLWLVFIATLFYFAVFATGCATAYNVSTELREIQIEMPHRIKPQYEKVDFKPMKGGAFIDNANVQKLVSNEKKHLIQHKHNDDIIEYLRGIIIALGGRFV